jgi:Kef-type K+ transport system membrane component KefB
MASLTLFTQLTAITVIALTLSLLLRHLRQPLIVGYLATGILVGPALLGVVAPGDAIDSFGKIGVALLLFVVGLGLKPALIREIGRTALVTGLGQIIFTAILGLGLALGLGYPIVSALYLAIAFTFSSTIVVLQLLYAKEEQDTLYGRIAIGFLLVQDFVALLLFLFLTSVNPGDGLGLTLLLVTLKGIAIGTAVYVLTRELLPRVERRFAGAYEVLLLFALATCFSVATLFVALGFSLELGALVAGVLLSVSPAHREIAARLAPLRDFFLITFFVVLGASVTPSTLTESWPTVAAFSIFILVGNPAIMLLLMRRFGYTLETSFFAALTVAQVSEFSLILLATGATLGHLPASLLGPATLVALITMFSSSYLIMHNRRLYQTCEPFLRRLFGPDSASEPRDAPETTDVILFGCHRLGSGLVQVLRDLELPCLVVDHDPEIVRQLKEAKVRAIFGSADDPRFLESLPIRECRTIISTIPEVTVNQALVAIGRRLNSTAVILCVANHQRHAEALYAAGATYVVVPPYLGRRYLIELLKQHRLEPSGYLAERSRHEQELRAMRDADAPTGLP